jgi:hypothetical protein
MRRKGGNDGDSLWMNVDIREAPRPCGQPRWLHGHRQVATGSEAALGDLEAVCWSEHDHLHNRRRSPGTVVNPSRRRSWQGRVIGLAAVPLRRQRPGFQSCGLRSGRGKLAADIPESAG